MSSAKWRQFCVRDNLLSQLNPPSYYLSYNAYTACEMIQLYHIVIHFMVMMSSCFEWVCVVAMRSSMCWCCEFLTHWGRVTHTCVSKLTINGSHNGLSLESVVCETAAILSRSQCVDIAWRCFSGQLRSLFCLYIIACCLFCTKPFSMQTWTYCWFDSWKQISA